MKNVNNLNYVYSNIRNGQPLNEKDIIHIFEKFDPLLKKYSWTINGFDYDLYSECKIAFLKCILKYKFDEESFKEIFQMYQITYERS